MVLVPLILQARDNASGVLQRFNRLLGETNQKAKETSEHWRDANGRLRDAQGRFVGLGDSARQAQGGFAGLTGAITGGVLQANLLTGAFTTAINVAQSGLGAIQGAIAQGTELQLQNVNAASAFSSIAGKSYAEAEAFVLRFNSAIGEQAAKLPGITEEYNRLGLSVQDSLIEGFKDERGILQMQKFENSLLSLSSSYGALTAASTRDIGNTALGLTKALGGGSIGELRNFAFFEQNQPILGQIERALEERGAGSLGDLELAERIELLQKAGESLITPDFIKNAGESVDGLVQGFRSTILDPTNGFLGIMRDVRPTLEGSQSVFSAFNDSLKILIGNGGVFSGLVELFQETGLSVDPMNSLYGGVQNFNSFLTNINNRLTNLNEALDEGGALTDMFSTYVEDAIADAKPFIKDLSGQLFSRLGDLIPPVVNFLSEAIIGAGKALYLVFDNIDYGSALISLGDALKGINWGRVAIAAGVVLGGAIVGGLTLGAAAIVGPIGLALGAAGLGIAGVISSTLQGRGEDLRMIFVGMWNSIKFPFINLFTDMRIAFANLKNTSTALVDQVKTALIALLTGLRDRLDFIPGVSRIQIPGTVQAGTSTGASQLGALGLRPVAGSRAGGQIPNAFTSLLSAAQVESRRAPAGASLVVANTSEAIIPRAAAVQPIASAATRGVQIGSISVQVNEAKTPQLTAEAVLQLIQSKFEQEYNAQLA